MSLAQHLSATYQLQIKEIRLIPAVGGVFEVSVNGDLVYSRRKTGKFPKDAEIDTAVEERLKART